MVNTEEKIRENIVIVEDDTEISRLTVMLLEAEGFKCHPIYQGGNAVNKIAELTPDLVVLDIMLPEKNGIEICSEIREFFSGPILMVTGCDDDITELSSFKTGADDYIIKPIKPHLLIARIRALLKRGKHLTSVNTKVIQAGSIVINCDRRETFIANEHVLLTDAEFDLLTLLVEHAGIVVGREECCQNLRGFDYDGLDRSIDMRVSSLRKKITPLLKERQSILTVRNRGYMLTNG